VTTKHIPLACVWKKKKKEKLKLLIPKYMFTVEALLKGFGFSEESLHIY
jgi:hypothetical protein